MWSSTDKKEWAFRIVVLWWIFAAASLVVQSWVRTADGMRAAKIQTKLEIEISRSEFYSKRSNRFAYLWQEEVKLNDAIERRFPNGFPPEDGSNPVETALVGCIDEP